MHPKAAEYLRQLEVALRPVPAARASELREQITAHLDEALPPDASDQEVIAVLRRLGRPSDLAAEAAAATAGKRPWPARLGWRMCALLAAVILIPGTVGGYLLIMGTARPLAIDSSVFWWNWQDRNAEVQTQADGTSQFTVPVRIGKQQGFVVWVRNHSGQTQTVLGLAEAGLGCTSMRVSVSTVDPAPIGLPPWFRDLHFTRPGTIPPHQARVLRVLWTSLDCYGPHTYYGLDHLRLRVRVGPLTRYENVPLDAGYALTKEKLK
jgi:hypothetical protein